MKDYSIIRVGHEYIVQADEKSILKIASRRRAARLVTDARELLELQLAMATLPDADDETSIARDPPDVP